MSEISPKNQNADKFINPYQDTDFELSRERLLGSSASSSASINRALASDSSTSSVNVLGAIASVLGIIGSQV